MRCEDWPVAIDVFTHINVSFRDPLIAGVIVKGQLVGAVVAFMTQLGMEFDRTEAVSRLKWHVYQLAMAAPSFIQ